MYLLGPNECTLFLDKKFSPLNTLLEVFVSCQSLEVFKVALPPLGTCIDHEILINYFSAQSPTYMQVQKQQVGVNVKNMKKISYLHIKLNYRAKTLDV